MADPRALYYASETVYKSIDTAQTWTKISGDLTRPDPGIPANLDAAAAAQVDRNQKRGVVYALAPSPLVIPMVWAGTDDGLIHVTMNDGKHWQDVTPPPLTPWSRVTSIEASHFDFNTAYASVDRHQLQDYTPYIYRTRDLGKSWQLITKGLPAGVHVHVVKEDTLRQGLLFAGTERGAFVSLDDGDSWQPLQLNLPVTSVRDFVVYGNDLVVATHGRGFWVIDDISPLRQVTDAILASDAYLFKPADAINYIRGGDNGTPLQKDEPQAQNPADGATIDFYLKAAAAGPVTLEILDAAGTVAQTFSTEGAARGGRRARRARGHPEHFAAVAHHAGAVLGQRRNASRRLGAGRRRWSRWWRRRRGSRWSRGRSGRGKHRHLHCEADGERPQLHADVHDPPGSAQQGAMIRGRAGGCGWAALLVTQLACSAGTGPARPVGTLPLGAWGGDSAGMTVTDSGMHLQIACTYGDVSGPIPVAADGSFDVTGSYMLHAYPIAVLPAVPAQFRGNTDGSNATITVIADDTVARQTVTHGPVMLRLGAAPRWGPCPV